MFEIAVVFFSIKRSMAVNMVALIFLALCVFAFQPAYATSNNIEESTYTLSWEESSGHHYRIEISRTDPDNGEITVEYAYTQETTCEITCLTKYQYDLRIQTVSEYGVYSPFSEPIHVAKKTQDLPEEFAVYQNHPNPFNPSTTISFSIPESERVTLSIFNITGQKIAELHDGVMAAGKHSIIWNASSMPSGTYFYRLTAGSYSAKNKMMLVK